MARREATAQRAKAGDPLCQVAESLARVEALATTLVVVAANWDRKLATMAGGHSRRGR